ncbi:toll-like receptor 13 [Pygocentrus nattereri]|uniref:TIR domain-containing protein n=1 Tax=Pygocentrus nattereri TaxID=42514 RepID=A0A3B4DM15_PYGNA|nr:toll-like receptor 13 [Pygocentrus nattereri]
MGNLKCPISMESTFFLLVLSCSVLLNLMDGYSLKDCTVKGSLNSTFMKVLCYKRQLRAVPESIPCKARVLDISYNKISVIKRNDLGDLTNLHNLNVSNNMIEEVEDGAFRGLAALQELNLAYNRLTTISGGFFQDLFNLTELRLNENHISDISSSAFVPLISLVMLNLSGNHLQYIHKAQPVFQMPRIQELHIGKNGFSSFETCQASNASLQLQVLDLSHNPLQSFRITADIFPHLETLDLAFNKVSVKWDVQDKNYFRNVDRLNLSGIQTGLKEMKIMLQTFNLTLSNLRLYYLGEQKAKSLAKEACLINSLTTLRLQSNNINSISENELRNCSNLRVLDLAENDLTEITALAFKSISKLNTLSLSHNKLSNVPIAIRNLSNLEVLDLSYNSITTLTCSDFTNLTRLMMVHIYRNHLSSVEHCAFQDLHNLKTLIMGSSRLFTLKGYFSNGLKNLKYLDLSNSKLNTIHKGVFECLRNLTYLHLQDNQIKVIEVGAFEGLQNLILLDVQSNKITQTSISASVFSGLTNLKELILNNNFIWYSSQDSLSEPPFKNLKSLHVLNIFSQGKDGMKNIPSNFLEGLTSLKIFWAGNLNLNSLHPDTFTYTPDLWRLDLSKNYLTTISPDIFMPLKKLSSLTMIQSGIQSLDFLIEANLNEIQVLLIRKNSIAVINETLETLSELFLLDLQGNEFSCDCDNAWFIDWAVSNNNTQVLKLDALKCNYPPNFRGNLLIDLDKDSCVVDVGLLCFVCTTSFVLLTLLSSFLYHFLKWQVVYTYYLFLAFLYEKKQQKKQTVQSFQYDAFISYNTHDELWVVKQLLPKLEGEQGWKLCLHHRDFQPGKPIMDNIVDGIYSSRKTLCVISRHYLESEWCSREIQVASFRLFDEKKDVLILVFLEEIPPHQLSPYYRMRSLIKKRTYLTWPKPGEDIQVFWQKLDAALEAKENS